MNKNSTLNTNVPRNVKQVDFKGQRKGRKTVSGRMSYKKVTYPMMYNKILSDVRYIKNSLNVEDKYNDVSSGGAAVSNTATLVLLNGLSLGNTSVTRMGQSVKAVDLQFNMTGSVSATAMSSYLRVIIFYDTQPNAAAPTAANLLANGGNYLSLRNVDYNERFRVEVDTIFNLDVAGPSSFVSARVLKLGTHTLFNTSNNGTILDITKNSLYLLLISNEAVNTPTFSYYSRFSFVDN